MTVLTAPVQQLTRWSLGHAVPALAFRARARRGDLQARVVGATNSGGDLPTDLFDAIREAGPFYRGGLALATSRHDVVREVLASPDVAAGRIAATDGVLARPAAWADRSAPTGPLTPPSLLAIEPPDHTRMRKLVTRVFSVRAVERLRERTEEVAAELVEPLARRVEKDEPVNLVEALAAPLPVTVICEVLGVPEEDRERVRHFGDMAAPSLDLGLSLQRFREVEAALRDFERWLEAHVERVRQDPGEDLFSQLVAARDDDGGQLDDLELKATAGLVLAAGFETTVNLISNAVSLLAEHPEQRKALVVGEVPWLSAVDEALRFDPPVLLTARTAVRDTEIAGTRVREGSPMVAMLAGANRDPEVFAEPNHFDVTRENAADHISFSSGRHYCLGAALARMEGEVALRTLHERLPELRVLPGAERRETRILRGWAQLPVG